MKTRIELWNDYRGEINSTIELQKSIKESNEKLKLLHKRLIDVYPDYEKKYPSNFSKTDFNLDDIGVSPSYSEEKIDEILEDIGSLDNFSNSFRSIDNLNFSSNELDDILENMKSRKINTEKHFKTGEDGISMNKPQKYIVKNYSDSQKELVVAIDGPSGSGKSTIAKKIANMYKLNYINTGLVYRAIALNAMDKKIDLTNEGDVVLTLKKDMIQLEKNEEVLLNGINVSKQVRANEVSQAASKIATHAKVREWAVKLQQKYGEEGGVIMDGRDTTFKVLPNADVKIFLETTPEERAKRRSKQNELLGYDSNYESILSEIKERDYRDKNRPEDPLQIVKDAVLIDATKLSIEETVELISNEIKKVVQ